MTPHLESTSPQVRGAAAKALGRMPGSRDALLAQLRVERNPSVRSYLAQALCKQGEPTLASLEAVNEAVATEKDVRARFAMARYLGENLERFPRGRKTLEDVLASETSTRIRRYIAGRIYAK